jgi:UDP-glucose 4-epimerase
MKILITGGAGFIGSHLAEKLVAEGNTVTVIDNLSTGREENLSVLKENQNFTFIKGTITDPILVNEMMEWCDQCYHLAAPVGVKYIMENPVLSILENVRGIDVMLAASHKHKKRTLVASTSEVYGKSLDLLDPNGTRKLREDDYRIEGSTMNHRWSYANCKSLDEFLSLGYFKQYASENIVVRFFNTVGPRQLSTYGMVIPNFVEAAIQGRDVVVYGNGEQRRSFLHVKDALDAITRLMGSDAGLGKVFNVGNPFEITMNDLALKIIQQTGSKSKITHISYEEAYGAGFEDMNRRTADIGKLSDATGFKINFDLDAILDDVIAWKRG